MNQINNNNNGDDDDDQENPLIQQHYHLHAFDREFNHSPDLVGLPNDALIAYILSKENSGHFDPPGQVPQSEKLWVQRFRVWMLEELVMKCFVDFWIQRYRTAYLAVVYFERFLSLQWRSMKWKAWETKLLGMTCLSLAAKKEEGGFPEMGVSHLPEADRIMDEIKRMEPVVLDVLGGSKGLITPLSLMSFMMTKFGAYSAGRGGNMASRTAAFIFAALKVNSTLDFRPSVVAAAATLAAMDPNLTRTALERRIRGNTIYDFGFTAAAEEVHACYASINKLDPYQELVFPAPSVQPTQDPGTGSQSATQNPGDQSASSDTMRPSSEGSVHMEE